MLITPNKFSRKYIPKLKNFPTQYIHSPWLAPQEVQNNANCVIGEDYPMPMVDHSKAARVNIQRIKQVYRKLAKYKMAGKAFSNYQYDLTENFNVNLVFQMIRIKEILRCVSTKIILLEIY